MANPNPHQARCARRKRRRIRKVGDLVDARRKLWQAIITAEDVLLDHESDTVMQLKAVHAITQATTAYAKLIEIGELQARLASLEEAIRVSREELNLESRYEHQAKTGQAGKGSGRTIIDRPRY